jgi:membrane protein implicated in regulation of membrane protease activity
MNLSSLTSIPAEVVWAILGIVFVFFEFFIPGLVIAFFGVGAIITALTTWIGITPSLELQLLVFIVSSILLLILLRRMVKRTFLGKTKGEYGDRDFNVDIGKIVPVIEFIQPGEVGGKVKYQGSNWPAIASEPIPPGESVKIIGRENITLIVEKVEKIKEEVK